MAGPPVSLQRRHGTAAATRPASRSAIVLPLGAPPAVDLVRVPAVNDGSGGLHHAKCDRRPGVRRSRRRRGGGAQTPRRAWARRDGCCLAEGDLSWLTRTVPTAP
jgi:hypothetical protein